MSDLLNVRVNTPEKVIWEGEAVSVSSANTQGPFDILPMHANFISIIEKNPIVVRTQEGDKEYKFDHSVIYASSNKVKIYTNI